MIGNRYITYEKQVWGPVETEGEGSCGLHALLGTKNSNNRFVYQCENDEKNLTPSVAVKNAFILKLFNDLKEGKKKIVEVYFKTLHDRFTQFRREKMDNSSLNNEGSLIYQNSEKGKQIFKKLLDTVKNKKEVTQEDILSHLKSTETGELYKKAFCDPSFYLNDVEIELGAYLFNKKVVIFEFEDKKYHQRQVTFNSEGKGAEFIMIAHRGVHYERCEKIGTVEECKDYINDNSETIEDEILNTSEIGAESDKDALIKKLMEENSKLKKDNGKLKKDNKITIELNQITNNELKIVKKQNVEQRKRIIGLIDEKGNLIDDNTFSQKITTKVKGIYDEVYVTQIDHTYAGEIEATPSRKIELKRSWCFMDTVPLVTFMSTLLKKNSIYRETVNNNVILQYVLDGEIIINNEQRKTIYEMAEEATKNNKMTVQEQYREIAEDFITNKDLSFTLKSEDKSLIYFLSQYKKEYEVLFGNGDKSLRATFWQSKSIIIIVPNENSHLSHIELKVNGVINPLAIKLGRFLRFWDQN
jgi:hypothetical protein